MDNFRSHKPAREAQTRTSGAYRELPLPLFTELPTICVPGNPEGREHNPSPPEDSVSVLCFSALAPGPSASAPGPAQAKRYEGSRALRRPLLMTSEASWLLAGPLLRLIRHQR